MTAIAPPEPRLIRGGRRQLATFDRHGAVLHAVATVLTRTPNRAEQLVVSTVRRRPQRWWSRFWRGASDSRAIVERLYVEWARHDLPRSLVSRGTDRSIRHELHLLSDAQLGALALCGVGGHTYRQAARVMGVTPVSAALDLRAALASLAEAGPQPAV